MSKLVFLRAWPRDPTTGAEVAIRLAGGGEAAPYVLGGEHYRAGIESMPRFSAAAGFGDKGWTGRALPKVTPIAYFPSSAALRDQLLALVWTQARIEIDTGDDYAAPTRALTGSIAAATWSDGRFTITAADESAGYNRAALTGAFGGTGGLDGYIGAKGRPRRRTWGVVRGIEAFLMDPVNNIYDVGDHAQALSAITAVRDLGRDGSITVLPWAGTANATLAALQAAVVPQGGAVVAPSIARLKWWTVPVGPLTVDIEGEIGAGYVATVPSIASRLVELAGGEAISNLAAANGWRPDAAGLHVSDTNETWAQAIDRLTLGASLFWRADLAGGSALGQWSFNDPATALNAEYIARKATLPPTRTRTVYYRTNNRPHGDAEISSALTSSAGAFALRAIANAEITAPNAVRKVTGGAAWNAKAATQQAYAGGASISASVPLGAGIGLTTDPDASTGYDTVDYFLRLDAAGSVDVYRNGVLAANVATGIGPTAFLMVTSDGTSVRYFVDGIELHSHAATSTAERLSGVGVIFSAGSSIVGISFAAAGIAGQDALSTETRYARSWPQPATPAGEDPAGWSIERPTGAATLWSSDVRRRANGSAASGWTTPVRESTDDHRGDYNAATAYYVTNLVAHAGGTYRAKIETSGNAPTGTGEANSWWDVVAAPGTPGAPSSPPSAFTATIAISSTTGLVSLRSLADAAGYTGMSAATITFNVAAGVTVQGLHSSGIAIDTGSWPSASYAISLTLNVSGTVSGGGGNGGNAGNGAGGAGGDAIYCRVPMTVTINAGGIVRGGGGGGGAGKNKSVITGSPEPDVTLTSGGGGGGGRPNGLAGAAYAAADVPGNAGAAGNAGAGGAGGAAGAGAGNGGGGGDFGASGGNGFQAGSTGTGGAGGAAGYAVRKNGNAVPVTNNGTMIGSAA